MENAHQLQGFRMTAGKVTSTSKYSKGLKFVCLQNKSTRFPELDEFPKQKCVGGIMTVHHFPASVFSLAFRVGTCLLTVVRCWDGKNLDSPDHQSHMYNTVNDAFQNSGACPASHPGKSNPPVAFMERAAPSSFDVPSCLDTDLKHHSACAPSCVRDSLGHDQVQRPAVAHRRLATFCP
jgi:hypothetical protein